MIIKDHNQQSVPLLNVTLELLQIRSVPGWKTATINSQYQFGMMLTTLAFTTSNGKEELVQIPTEFCKKLNEFRLAYNTSSGQQVNNITLKIESCGVYDLEMV